MKSSRYKAVNWSCYERAEKQCRTNGEKRTGYYTTKIDHTSVKMNPYRQR